MKVRIENLAFDYADFHLRIAALEFAAGRLTSIVGPNGAGKSTLLKCMASVVPAPHGSVFANGQDLGRLRGSERAKLVGYVPQEPSFTFN